MKTTDLQVIQPPTKKEMMDELIKAQTLVSENIVKLLNVQQVRKQVMGKAETLALERKIYDTISKAYDVSGDFTKKIKQLAIKLAAIAFEGYEDEFKSMPPIRRLVFIDNIRTFLKDALGNLYTTKAAVTR